MTEEQAKRHANDRNKRNSHFHHEPIKLYDDVWGIYKTYTKGK